ncbi:hypothetical protein MMMDOFMJ_4332 [Methylobacterium gnaphalii]|uniref:Uncharacterized protein n=1 Tax=Methylobacterium gnaphalii TaxID=1010610 RepID=A0A512JRT6_9HYPH|nr:hypothetical protein MGN01_45130 [Methylobacterium gnaphalii]GJD71376.1 hypothetical protein MMMDOFMJ_4332 [Methylobacterium gnaphalii]GLS51390.1 hypothetical protein GCM10007885_42470 [Methylobacterium gnaphalii]
MLEILCYGGRLDNKLPNDGWDFRGRGDVQATGRDNAQRANGRLQDLGYLTKALLTPSGVWLWRLSFTGVQGLLQPNTRPA